MIFVKYRHSNSVTIRLSAIRIRGRISGIFGYPDNIFETDRMKRINGSSVTDYPDDPSRYPTDIWIIRAGYLTDFRYLS